MSDVTLVRRVAHGRMAGDKLTRPQQYKLVYDTGASWADSLVVLKALKNGTEVSRYGISVSRRVGKAVTRNRVKRQLREIIRAAVLEPGWDVVFIARPAAAGSDYASLAKSVNGLLLRSRLLKTGKHAPVRTETNPVRQGESDECT